MMYQLGAIPDEANAVQLVLKLLNIPPLQATRFRTGLAHYVYDVVLPDQRHVVARMAATSAASLHGTVYWSQRLRPLDIPLPRLLGDDRQARLTPFPALLLEYLPGTDLGHVYLQLSHTQKVALAKELAHVQRKVATLPPGRGYGYAISYDDSGLFLTWTDVIEHFLARSQTRIASHGRVSQEYAERVRQLLHTFSSYLSSISSTAFLDDTTTKNVLIHNGQLSGIVDVDYVCFGDPLFTIGLTRMALLSMNADLDYIDAWCDALALNAQQRTILTFYTCLFCVDFFSEIGDMANHNTVAADEKERIQHLELIFEQQIKTLLPIAPT